MNKNKTTPKGVFILFDILAHFYFFRQLCIYTTTLEPILAKIAESEQPRTPPRPAEGGATPQQNFLLHF